MQRALRERQAKRFGSLVLVKRDRLQAAAHHFGEVGGGERFAQLLASGKTATPPAAPTPPEESASLTESLPSWITDAGSGCRIWNANPRPNERVEWTGRCDGGMASGTGIVSWLENDLPTDRYEGEYRNGQENGRGIYRWANGDRYDGEWRDGERSGRHR
jgi:hypothetical protein